MDTSTNENEIDLLIDNYFNNSNKSDNSDNKYNDNNYESDTEDEISDSDTENNDNNDIDKTNFVKMTKHNADRIYSKPLKTNKTSRTTVGPCDDMALGIDLGTSNTCGAVWVDNNLIVIPDEFGNRTIPSIVAFTKQSRYIGLDAKNQTEINPKNVIYEVKRLIGKKINDETVKLDKEFMTYDIDKTNDNDDNILIKTECNKSFSPEEISAMILQKIKMNAEDYFKRSITKAVITIPANFNDAQRQATKDAATIAGLECIRIIHEPTAAALAYGLRNKSIKYKSDINIVVYDFGGGTLDVSLLNISDGLFEVMATCGISHLGGSDFDKKIMKYCLAYFKKIHNILSFKAMSNLSLQKLKRLCENAKKVLSTSTKTIIAIKDFYDNKDLYIVLTQDRLVEICKDLLIISLDPLDDVLKANKMRKDEIDEIIMVGGMTRMPAIRENIKKFFNGKEPNYSVNPDEVIAMGAAIQAHMLINEDDPFSESVRLLDITPLSLGVETIGGVMNTLVKRNTVIPYSKKRLYTTDSDYDTSVLIKIFEGERKMTKDNFFVGDFELKGIEALPRGVAEIEVKFDIDVNGIITVSAEDTETKNKNVLQITGNKGRLSKDQINKMVKDGQNYELKDRVEKIKKQLYYEIDDLCSNIKINIRNDMYKLSTDDKNSINDDIQKIEKWLKDKIFVDRDENEFKTIIDKIKKRYGTLILKANLDNDDKIKGMSSTNESESTTIYGDDSNDNDDNHKNVFDKIEDEEFGFNKITDTEKNEIKELRECLTDLCDNLFLMLTSNNMNMNDDDIFELRDYIDDTLLWMHVHMKSTKNDYKIKLDSINNKCDEIMKKYNSDKEIFKYNDIINCINSPRDELEQLCYLMKSTISCNILTLKQEQINEIEIKIDDCLNWLLDVTNESCDESIYIDKINEINEFCNKMYYNHEHKIDGINLNNTSVFDNHDENINNYYIDNNDDEIGGVSIADILKRKAQIN